MNQSPLRTTGATLYRYVLTEALELLPWTTDVEDSYNRTSSSKHLELGCYLNSATNDSWTTGCFSESSLKCLTAGGRGRLNWINQSKSETTRQGVHRGSHRKRSAPGLGPGRAHLTFAFKKLYGPFMLFRSFPGFKGSEVLSTTGRQILLSRIEPILT